MSIVIGIDAGISSTKIIGIENGKRIMTPMSITGNNNVASIYGILGAYLVENQASYSDVEHVMLTGIGAQDITTMVNDCPFTYIDEFKANGIGAKFDTGLDRFIVVSMGTISATSAASAWAAVLCKDCHNSCSTPATSKWWTGLPLLVSPTTST